MTRLAALLLAALSSPLSAAPALRTLDIPGTPAFARAARDVLDVRFALDPSIPSGAGLFDDAARVPDYGPGAVGSLTRRLDRDLNALEAMPWRSWDIERRIDWRWMIASAEDARRQLHEEHLFTHRPSQWLEPAANDLINLVTYAPERGDLRDKIIRLLPAMVAQMRKVCLRPTARDVSIADGVSQGILKMLRAEPAGAERDAAIASLTAYLADLRSLKGLPEFEVIGRANYEWRLKNALLIPWTPLQLLGMAQRSLADTDAAMEELKPKVSSPTATAPQKALARDLTQERLLAVYDEIPKEDRAFLDRADLMTIPPGVGPIRARPTPDAMIPLTGDGGSMNPPPAWGSSDVGWWNVEHFKPDWTPEHRLEMVVNAQDFRQTDMGPYAVHEGVPGHHLQLSLARLNGNPLRNILQDNTFVEGWALYAENMFWAAGGLGPSADAEYQTLDSWRFRIRRVFYDVHVECGDWTLQDAGDFKSRAREGKGAVDEDVLRTINWPAQLIAYFTGKNQILALRREYRDKLGKGYSDRKFHDALLAEGSIPVALIRAKLLNAPVPPLH